MLGKSSAVSRIWMSVAPVAPPPPPSGPPAELITWPISNCCTPSANNISSNVAWYRINVTEPVTLGISTEGSDDSLDTEIGLYDSLGNLLSDDDDSGEERLSKIITDTLEAGTYYIAVGLYDTDFGETNFNVTAEDPYPEGCQIKLNVFEAPPLPTADFIGSPRRGVSPLTVNFTDLSTSPLTSRSWNFGNGTSSTAQNPSATYSSSSSQSFNVSLSVANQSGSDYEMKNSYIYVDAWPQYLDYRLQQTESTSQEIAAYGTTENGELVDPDYGIYNYTVTGDNPCNYSPADEPDYIFFNAAQSGKIKLKRLPYHTGTIPWTVDGVSIFDTPGVSYDQLLVSGDRDTMLSLLLQYNSGSIPNPVNIAGTEYILSPSRIAVYTNNFTMYEQTCPAGVIPGIGAYPSRTRISMEGTQSRQFITRQQFFSAMGVPTSISVMHTVSGQTKNYTLDESSIYPFSGSDGGYSMFAYQFRYIPAS